jgi:hypothetical protein
VALLPPLCSRCVVLSVDRPPETSPVAVDALELSPSASAAWSALRSGRRFSGVLAADADADLLAAAAAAGVPVLSTLDDAQLVAVPDPGWGGARSDPAPGDAEGQLVAVCGTGGTGASTLAAALAARGAGILEHTGRGAAGDRVLLADFALRAEQGHLHWLGDPAFGLLDLIDIGRVRPLTDDDVRRRTYPSAGYRLLPGLRRPAHWTAIAPGAFDVVLDGLLRRFDVVVADITGEFEGEAETGSADVEERNHMARHTVGNANVVLALGRSGGAGRRRLAALVDDLLDHGVEPARIQPVIGGADPAVDHPARLCGLPALPISLPWRRTPDGSADPLVGIPAAADLNDGVGPLVNAVALLVARLARPDRAARLARVEPGALGCALS